MTIAYDRFQDITATTNLALLHEGAQTKNTHALHHIAENFESIILKIMISEMRKSIPESTFFNDHAMRMWESFYDDHIAHQLAKQFDLGLSRQLGIPDKTSSTKHVATQTQPLTSRPSRTATFTEKHSFIMRIQEAATPAARTLGIPKQYLIAHAALESGWGQHEIMTDDGQSAHNLLGIKASKRWHGPVTLVMTKEYTKNGIEHIPQLFRVYNSDRACFDDYVHILESQQFSSVDHGEKASHFLQQLSKHKYATDPLYKKKLLDVINTIEKDTHH